MLGYLPLVGAVAALSFSAVKGHGDAALAWRSGEMVPHLEVRARLDGAEERTLTIPAERPGRNEPPPCVADVCQARVEVPGLQVSFGRPHRSELFVALLDRAGIEPFATIAWMFVATGFRLDWTPPTFDAGDPAGGRGPAWGSVFVRLRLRIDPMNHPVFPHRNRSRAAERSWSSFISPRA
jgi:hypothetical protein